MVYHLILGEEATVQHIPPSGPDEIGDLVPNHAGLGRAEEIGETGVGNTRPEKLLLVLLSTRVCVCVRVRV